MEFNYYFKIFCSFYLNYWIRIKIFFKGNYEYFWNFRDLVVWVWIFIDDMVNLDLDLV